MRPRVLRLALSQALALLALLWTVAPLSAEIWHAGGYSFSDELGGLGIRAITGSGQRDDPIVIVEEILDHQPVTLVVRETVPRDPASSGDAFMSLAITLVATNRTRRVWAGFNLELREDLSQPSTYFDGLSFWQMAPLSDRFRADRFGIVKRRAEPSDVVHYRGGSVDPGSQLSLWFQVSDTSPTSTFYLIQEPEFLMAQRPEPGASLAKAVGPWEAGRRQTARLGTFSQPAR